MIDGERFAALERLEQARHRHRRISLELDKVAATIARWEGDARDDRPDRIELLVFWYARRTELLRMALDAAGCVAAIYMGLNVPNDVRL